ncbi:hypothetical protein [Paraburkholderia caffeinilytica]|uniref:hypothetical protein n=1 Tax=Paraburkholderia caffeinilytica TaxID=1761016 RepID=UPI003D9FE84A
MIFARTTFTRNTLCPDTFDRNPSQSLHLFEHVHGESRERGQVLLDEAIHIFAAIGDRLARNGSSYARVFVVLRQLGGIEPEPMVKPPVRDMDKALEVFGVGPDGVEPLLTPTATHTIQLYPRGVEHGSSQSAHAHVAKDTR